MIKKQLKQITVLTSILFIANFPNVLADETSSIDQKTAIITEDTVGQNNSTVDEIPEITESTDKIVLHKYPQSFLKRPQVLIWKHLLLKKRPI